MNLVDVVIGSYNHEKFIAQSIESVLEQRTSFNYRIIIGDDGSTDNTQNIILKYANKYPDKIEAILYKRNKGLIGKNVMRRCLYEKCKAKYVTILEGDDFWIDKYKLENQVTYMEEHIRCSICYHPVKIEYLDTEIEKYRLLCEWKYVYGLNKKNTYTLQDFLLEPLRNGGSWPEIPIAGMMLRWKLIQRLPEWFWFVLRADTALHFLFLQYGTIEKMDTKCMAIHRKHKRGISYMFFNNPDVMDIEFLKLLLFIDKEFDYRLNKYFKVHIKELIKKLFHEQKLKSSEFKKLISLWYYFYKKNLIQELINLYSIPVDWFK